MNIKATWKNGKLFFKNFVIVKEKETFWGVYERAIPSYYPIGDLITSGETLDKAAKKAKLLQIGYNICKDNFDDGWHF